MSSAGNPPGAPEHRDPTFRVYNAAQAARYAKYRAGFVAPNVVKFVLAYHGDRPDGSSVGLKSFLDVGTGPGAVARAMAPYFERVVGVDAGEAMLGAARSLGGKTKAGEEIGYILCPAEEIDKIEDAIPHGSVDLVAAQAAAHWFDMAAFYAAAAKVLKPGGTLALWTHSSFYARGFPT